jgi:putative ABC transport system permease protein
VRDGQRFVAGAEVIPTGAGDPLLSGVAVPRQEHQVVLSASAARRLDLKPGEAFRLMVSRKIEGQNQRAAFALTVSGVLDDARFARSGAFITLPLLVALEDYRDGYQVPLLQVSEGKPPRERTRFSRARVYARSLDDVRRWRAGWKNSI